MGNLTAEAISSYQYQLQHVQDTRVPGLISSAVICLTLAYTAVALRFLSRRLGHVKLGNDDWCTLVALVRSIPTSFNGLPLSNQEF